MNKKIKYILFVMAAAISLTFFMNIEASASDTSNRVIDEAGVINSSDEAALNSKIRDIMKENFDVVILTVKSLNGKTPEAYADDYYDYGDYGLDNEHSGVIFLLSMGERKYHISTTGKGINVFTDYGIGEIKDRVEPDLKNGNYYDAFDKFLDVTKEFYTAYKEGNPYDTDNPYISKTDVIIIEIIGFIVAFVIALISVGIMKFKMNNARPKAFAGEYIRNGSMAVTDRRDMFLYSNVSKTKRETDSSNNSSDGSSTHTGSSGSSHGGGGGSF